jgi:demethylmenaquinone methyltransferase / 2-methoxy-6-polyprenyl-1,4-benzoquinol methylase
LTDLAGANWSALYAELSGERWRRAGYRGRVPCGSTSKEVTIAGTELEKGYAAEDLTVVTAELVDKREERIRRMFGHIAPSYDFLNHLLSLNIDRYWRWRTTRMVPPQGSAPILDLCTGTGDLALAYDRAAGGAAPIFGADFCHEMLQRAGTKVDKQGAGARIRFLEADAQHLPFPADRFQIVTVAFGLRNVTDTDRGIREMVRVARPGGKVAILEFSQPRGWLFGRLYRFYFRHVLPRIGQMISRSEDNAYRYLPASVMEFPDGEALAERLRSHGLVDVHWQPLTFGIATLYVGTKACPPAEGRA